MCCFGTAFFKVLNRSYYSCLSGEFFSLTSLSKISGAACLLSKDFLFSSALLTFILARFTTCSVRVDIQCFDRTTCTSDARMFGDFMLRW